MSPRPRAVSCFRFSPPAIFHAARRSQPARLGDQTDYQEGHAAPLLSPAAVAAAVGVFYSQHRAQSLIEVTRRATQPSGCSVPSILLSPHQVVHLRCNLSQVTLI